MNELPEPNERTESNELIEPNELIERWRAMPSATDEEGSDKVDLLVEFEGRLDEPPVLELFLAVVTDPADYDLARIEALKIARLWPPRPGDARLRLGRAIAAVLSDQDDDELVRTYAAGALGAYTEDEAVFREVAAAVTADEDLDLRFQALASIEEAGPTAAGRALLGALAADPDLGKAAARIAGSW